MRECELPWETSWLFLSDGLVEVEEHAGDDGPAGDLLRCDVLGQRDSPFGFGVEQIPGAELAGGETLLFAIEQRK